ncbi:acyl-CoA N-acyltransferase [Lineolata rhizophorae]|uniref:Acyl-CoA N-acyltransferase n=1 Tax=Lineolata rhizophorae TaxID=578093 RepID=A0A6A6NZD4_9PEZI|nr:acyl-CoA N-acyltransferase [Lineolata rhizophorae]
MSTEFITLVPPPGSSLAHYDRHGPSSTQSSSIPTGFKEAMSVREEVFVDEQNVPLENEFDDDDARSYHWIVYASVGRSSTASASPPAQDGSHNSSGPPRQGSDALRVPVGTLRLVPPPHAHPPGNPSAPFTPSPSTAATASSPPQSAPWDGHEAYVKLGRLAVVRAYRGLGLGKLLVREALEWAARNGEAVVPRPKAVEMALAAEAIEPWKGLVFVHAQKVAVAMWRKVGFVLEEKAGTWDEEGIEHVLMWQRLQVTEEVPVGGGDRRRSSAF